MRDCGVEGYEGPQGPRKLLDNGDFGLATWEHQSPSPLLKTKGTNFSSANTPSLGCCKHPSSHKPPSATTRPLSFLHSAAASIPTAIPAIAQRSQPCLLFSYH
ncbi:unnamed protein product [Prunus brigantina]